MKKQQAMIQSLQEQITQIKSAKCKCRCLQCIHIANSPNFILVLVDCPTYNAQDSGISSGNCSFAGSNVRIILCSYMTSFVKRGLDNLSNCIYALGNP